MEKNTENLDRIKYAADTLSLAEADLRDAVICAILDGASWAEVGHKLGISKQTAHNRYASEVAYIAKVEAGEVKHEITDAARAEEIMSATYNPLPRVDINLDRDRHYRRTLHTAAAVEPSNILDESVAGDSVTPSIFSDAPAPASCPVHGYTHRFTSCADAAATPTGVTK